MRLIVELDQLHASYVEAVNIAVAEDDLDRADRLATAYDDAAWELVAQREGKSHLLPTLRPTPSAPDTPLRRLVARLRTARAA